MHRPTTLRLQASALAVAFLIAIFATTDRPAVQAGSEATDRGAELFAASGCAHCHGDRGIGGGRGPDLQMVRKRRDTASITKQIHDGGMGMPPYGSQLSDAQIKDLVAFLRQKRKIVPVPPRPETPPPAASPAE